MESFCRDSGIGIERFEPRTRYFPDAGLIFLRSEPCAEMLSFDASRWGGGHCHLSRNSVEFFLGERRLLRDGGIYSYDTHDPFMAFGKGTRSHNTVNLNGWNQTTADPSGTRFFQKDDRAIVTSNYEGGYCPGPFIWSFSEGSGDVISARHHRTLFWQEGRFALVIDLMENFQKRFITRVSRPTKPQLKNSLLSVSNPRASLTLDIGAVCRSLCSNAPRKQHCVGAGLNSKTVQK